MAGRKELLKKLEDKMAKSPEEKRIIKERRADFVRRAMKRRPTGLKLDRLGRIFKMKKYKS